MGQRLPQDFIWKNTAHQKKHSLYIPVPFFSMYKHRWHFNLNKMVVSSKHYLITLFPMTNICVLYCFRQMLFGSFMQEGKLFLLRGVHQLTIILRKRSFYFQCLHPSSHPHMKLLPFFFSCEWFRCLTKALKTFTHPMHVAMHLKQLKKLLSATMWLNPSEITSIFERKDQRG